MAKNELPLERMPLAELMRRRLGSLLDQLGSHRVPDLYRLVIREVEKVLIEQALKRAHGSRKGAAEILGIHRNTLGNKMRVLGITKKERP